MRKKLIITSMAMLPMMPTALSAQDFIELTSSQMRIDTILPSVSHFMALPKGFKDSLYSVQLYYPEYRPMTRRQRRLYRKLSGNTLPPSVPSIKYSTFEERGKGLLGIEFSPVVNRDGRLCFLSSFMPKLQSVPANAGTLTRAASTRAAEQPTYAENSVLREGKWAKIKISSTGIQRLTADVIRQAGFTDLSKVRIYGYGGAIIPERLTQDYLREHDDLKEIPSCTVNGVKHFYGQGPVSWDSNTAPKRNRNFYSNYGYYFITQADGEPQTCSEDELLQQVSSSADAHHFLYENDRFAWAELGRNLVDSREIKASTPMTMEVVIPAGNTSANIQVAVTAGSAATYNIICGTRRASGSFSFGEYDRARIATHTFTVNNLEEYPKDENGATLYPVVIEAVGPSSTLRLDYVSANFATPAAPRALADGNYPAAQYDCNITNQNLHADAAADLVIIIPTSQKLRAQAEALAECHRTHDNMSVRIIPADELYNEFSSGTPDVSAYRRYLKMFYDKATNDNEIPKHVLLFGDAMWDNRMITLSPSQYSPDDYLLAYETEDSYNMITSIAADDFITVLKDNTTIHTDNNTGRDPSLQFDVAVGRIPVVQSGEAKNVVDKITHYITSSPSGPWQNEIMFIGDDGDNNSHMSNINACAEDVINNKPGYNVKKVMLDAYELKSTATGNTYPEATAAVKKQQNDGALIMNYGGHASWTLLAHEKLLMLSDFANFKGSNYSLWFTAGCETVPFDGMATTLGETALLNPDGGAVAFVGTVRTVLETMNAKMNIAFMRHVLRYDSDGAPLTVGEALRQAKNDLVTGSTSVGTDLSINKHHYVIIGDPAMRLALPKYKAVIDQINDLHVNNDGDDTEQLKGNSVVNVRGHIVSHDYSTDITDFNGTANILVRDNKETIECRNNNDEKEAYTYTDRPSTLYRGTCSVQNGQFTFSFKMPRTINDNNLQGLITMYAIDPRQHAAANGECDRFTTQGWEDTTNDLIGPSIHAYLNSPTFTNGDAVGYMPFFAVELSDRDGINATGAPIGHNMELVIDGDASRTYDLNDNFQFDSGSYTSGQTYYVIPELSPGSHSLSFKAWDLLGNSNTVSLSFRVVKGLKPEIADVNVAPSIIKDAATFYVTHDMRGSRASVCIDIIDPSGRIVDVLTWDDVLSESSPTTTFRWTPSGISRGLYLYRVRLSCNGSDYVSKTKKLIISQ